MSLRLRAGRRFSLLVLMFGAVGLMVSSSAHAVTFTNPGAIAINDATGTPPTPPAVSTPYPADVAVSGVTGPVTKVTATLHGFSHECSSDIDMILVGPGGQSTYLMSDTGDCTETAHSPIELTFDDSGPPLPCLPNTQTVAGTYAPTDQVDVANCNDAVAQDVFNPPAPVGPYPASLAVFNGLDPNGTWHLYTVDQFHNDTGSIGGGYSINLTITPATLSTAPSITGKAEVGQTLTAASGTIGNGGVASYQWSRCNAVGTGCATIAAATGQTYKPVAADKGHTLVVTETATNSGGASAPKASAHTATVGPAVLSSGGTKLSQNVVKQRGLVSFIRSNIGGSVVASATVNVPNSAKTVRFKSVKRRLTAGKRTKIKLKLSKSQVHTIRSALARGRKLKAKLRLTVTDAAGAKSVKRVTVKLKA